MLIILGAGILLVVPGLLMQQLLLPMHGADWSTRLAVGVGFSLCGYPILLIWTDVVGIRMGSLTVWIILLMSIVVTGWLCFRLRVRKLPERQFPPTIALPDVVLVGLLVLLAFSRLYVLRDLEAPMWGDSVQHAMISQLIVDHGGVFNSWLPYAPYATFTVHLGFHAYTAFIMWLTGADVLSATLVAGQLMNIAAVLVLIPLAKRMCSTPWAGVGVVLVAGLLSPLPAEYVNWGRYPQLAGQVILPVMLWLLWLVLERGAMANWRLVTIVSIVAAGMFLTYYRMPHYALIFVVVGIAYYILGRRYTKHEWRSLLMHLIIAVIVAMLLVTPWLLRLGGGALAEGNDPAQSRGIASVAQDYINIKDITLDLVNPLLTVLAIGASGWVIARRKQSASKVAIWGILLTLLPIARILPIPGVNNLQAFSVLVSMYIPICLLVGYIIDEMLSRLARARRSIMLVALCGLALVSSAGAIDRTHVVDPNYRMLTAVDLGAMQWIRKNIPTDALFLVDGFLIYDGRSAVGSDGGWWIPLLTQRRTTMPPQYPLLAEKPIDPAYNGMVVQTISVLRRAGVTSAEGVAWLCRIGVTHVYIGQARGSIGTPPPRPMLSVAALNQSAQFTFLYREDQVAIYALDPHACQ